jgi:hypothetical protein
MGWWDVGIMGGDTPLDIQGHIDDMILGEWDGKSDRDISAEQLDQNLADILRLPSTSWVGQTTDDQRIFFQVVGYNILTTGAKMPKSLRKQVLDACKQEIDFLESDSDEIGWLNPERRVAHLKAFSRQVEKYRDGQAVEVHNRGLFEQMASGLEGVVICHPCGHENKRGANYCGHCGKLL